MGELPDEHVVHLHRNPATRPDRDFFEDGDFALLASRFRSRRAALGKLIEGKAQILITRPAPGSRKFSVGERIFHEKFGYGRIEAIDGDKLEITFEKAGRKKVVDSFVEPA